MEEWNWIKFFLGVLCGIPIGVIIWYKIIRKYLFK